jgi:surface carbohydrate biosynthesis protein
MAAVKRPDVLWLIEHVAREMDVACAVKCIAEGKHGLTIEIKNISLDAPRLMTQCCPRVVALPFFYHSNNVAVFNYLERWPKAVFFNLAWEEIFYKGQKKDKAPSDDVARHKVIHHAWGRFFERHLLDNRVTKRNIHLNGNPVLQLYQDPYKKYFPDRTWLSARYGLDEKKRWIFVPENYRWAFVRDQWIEAVTQRKGRDRDELVHMRSFAAHSLAELMTWCNRAAENGSLEIIFRPKPWTRLQDMEDFFAKSVGEKKSCRFHFIKNESVREWILASDVVISSFSTTLIEAALADKPAFMVEPLPLIEPFHNEWYDHVARIKNLTEFEKACFHNSSGVSCELKSWASSEMLANGDPIAGLAAILSELVGRPSGRPDLRSELTAVIQMLKQFTRRALGLGNAYFNVRTHENDIFDDELVKRKTRRWSQLLCSI